MALAMDVWSGSVHHSLYPRSGISSPETATKPPTHKVVGICLAVASGVFIGTSFVLKKMGLLKANVKYNEEAGEGYGYLRNAWWWAGMTLMIIGEICNFAAYAFVDAILVTPLGALSVVITTILSAIFLKERLSFVGKVGCFICIVGSAVIVVNAPKQSSIATIQQMQKFVIAPGFLSYAGVVIIACTFLAIWAGPRYGKKSMMVYLSICSLIGGLSVVATQGVGAAVLAQAGGTPQFNQWFLYVLFAFVLATLVTEIIYLNKALNIYNAALVTPTYYVFFTTATIVSSAILFRGFKGTPGSIATVVMGFLQICSGVILLQLSKSAKDVPDAAVFTGDLDQVRTVAEQQEPEYEPKADAIRGTAALIRNLSVSRQKWEAEEAKRLQEERLRDQEPLGENEQFEWDGLRRRRTMSRGSATTSSLHGRKTPHPPLGMSHAVAEMEEHERETHSRRGDDGADGGTLSGRHSRGGWWPSGRAHSVRQRADSHNSTHQVRLATIPSETHHGQDGSMDRPPPIDYAYLSAQQHHEFDGGLAHRRDDNPSSHQHTPIRWAAEVGSERAQSPPSNPPKPPPHTARRQFSFQNVFSRHRDPHHHAQQLQHDGASDAATRPRSRLGLGSRHPTNHGPAAPLGLARIATEEERLGLVRGDNSSSPSRALPEYTSASSSSDEDGTNVSSGWGGARGGGGGGGGGNKTRRQSWNHGDEKEHLPRFDFERKNTGAVAPAAPPPPAEKHEQRWRQISASTTDDSVLSSSSTTTSAHSDLTTATMNEARERELKEWESRGGGGSGGGGLGGGGGTKGAFL